MEEIQEWWCVKQKHMSSPVCASYGKSENLKDENEIREMAKPPGFKELDEMHTGWCAQLSKLRRESSPVCEAWERKKRKGKSKEL